MKGTYRVSIERTGDRLSGLIFGRYWWHADAWREWAGGGYYSAVTHGFTYTERGAERRAARCAKRHAARSRRLKPKPEPRTYTLTVGQS